MKDNCFTKFKASIEPYELPQRFTFPFYYTPHPLAVLAAEELQQHLKTQTEWHHNFGIDKNKEGIVIGKMFGVLVVQNQAGALGYLSAFSGKLGDGNHHRKFVPPVFDILSEGSFFNVGLANINKINAEIVRLEQAPDYIACQQKFAKKKALADQEIQQTKQFIKTAKAARKIRRATAKATLSETDYKVLEGQLSKESQGTKIRLKRLLSEWRNNLKSNELELERFVKHINDLKEKRSAKSAALQQKIFHQYRFLNQKGEYKDLVEIFTDNIPIAGAGECAAPKLLQYAFLHQLKPIALAEFWWGESPKSEVRQHENFYPACQGKCKPILGHMLDGIALDDNPMLVNTALGREVSTVYEDDVIVVINKPTEFLSVPGKNVQDSVALRMQVKYPEATGPMVVHRLDMSTSGLMLIAKTKEAYKYLQYQFIKRRVKKRYVALLDGIVQEEEGSIDLPLRVDLEDRPRQLVCYEHGKRAKTEWKVIERSNGQTRIHFFPITGRTHQLRVHAAHPLGLHIPIVGDDLYGRKGERLHLHAEMIEFQHPESGQMVRVEVEAGF